MGLNNLGLGMIIRARDMASAVFRRVQKSIASAKKTAQQFGTGMGQISMAARGGAMAMAPFTVAMGFGVKTALDFEQGLQNVSAVLRGVSEEDMAALTAKAKEVGARTAFSAVQATEGMENLARAGFDAGQSITALDSVVSAAAAEGITDLGSATNTIVTTIKSMGQGADQASHAANVLALVSSKTNTNMTLLGEGFKMAGPQASALGVSLEDTAMALGMLADAGLKGTMGGTSFNAMLMKLTRPTAKAEAGFKKLGVELKTSAGDMRPLGELMVELGEALPELGGNMDQAAFLSEAFGIRGAKAANLLAKRMREMGSDMRDGKDGPISALKEFQQATQNASEGKGAAKEMAEIRLKSLSGAFTILKSSVEGVLIEGFTPFVKMLGPMVKGFADFLGDIAKGVDLLNAMEKGSKTAGDEFNQLGSTQQEMAKGFRDAIQAIMGAIEDLVQWFRDMGGGLRDALGDSGIRTLTKFTTIFFAILAVAAPVAAAIAGIGFLISSVIVPAVSGLGAVIGAVFSPWGLLIIGAIALVWKFRDAIWEFAGGLWGALVEAWGPIKAQLTTIWNSLKAVWDTIAGALSDAFGSTGKSAAEMGQSAGKWIGEVLTGALKLVAGAVKGFAKVFKTLRPILAAVGKAVGALWGALKRLLSSLTGTEESMTDGAGVAQMYGEILGHVFGILATAVQMAINLIAGAVNIVAAIVSGIVDVFMSVVRIIAAVFTLLGALIEGDWATAWDAAKTIVFEVVKGIITIVGTLVQAVAAAVDAIGAIFGKDLGAQDFMAAVQKDLVKDVEVMIKGQEQVARERAAQRAKGKARPAQTVAAAPPPRPEASPAVAAATAGQDAQVAAIRDLGTQISAQPINAKIAVTSKLIMDGTQVAEVIERVNKQMKARETR